MKLVRLIFFLISLQTCLLLLGCSAANLPLIENSMGKSSIVEYRIGAGDMLQVTVWDNPNLTHAVLVRPDGYITLPLLSDVRVQGISIAELNKILTQAYTVYLKEPTVTAMLVQANNLKDNQLQVIGEAVTPAAIPYQTNMTLMDIMIRVGGLSDYAAGNRAILMRQDNGKTMRYRVRLQDLMKKGDLTANAPVYPGDVILIPQAWF